MWNFDLLLSKRLTRLALFVLAMIVIVALAACGGSPAAPISGLQHRAFISNQYAGVLQIVDTQDDMTNFTGQSVNTAGQLVQGQAVSISVSTSVTFEVLSPDATETLVYDPSSDTLYLIDNASESISGTLPLASPTSMALFSPDGTKVYVPEPNAAVSGGGRNGLVQVWDVASQTNTANLTVAAARYVAISPNGQYLLVFSDNSDSVVSIDTTTSTVTYVNIPGFARPVNAFFTSDSNTAYVISCGPECGSSGAASVSELNIPTQTITATVPVGGASVGLLNGTTLYVAGSPVPPGTSSTFDAVNIGNMTRLTANSVPIGDGFHTTMALAKNNKLYIGATTCSNTTTGCLSVVDVSANTADPPLPPRGAITGLLAIGGRNVVYAIEGGYVDVYNTTNDTLIPNELQFTGALYGIVQVDQ